MKKNTKKQSSKPRQNLRVTKKSSPKKKVLRRARPVHKKVALHPVNILFMLIMGVLLIMSTINAAADSYTVSAVVPNPPAPASPAVITSPADGQVFTGRTITVSGTCPTDPYTNVYIGLITDNVLTAYGNCTNNTFSVNAYLYYGVNSIQVRVFDWYNTPGPLLPAIHVTYNAPYVPPQPSQPSQATSAIVAPQAIQLLQVDNTVPFSFTSGALDTSDEPLITGTAPPFSHIVIEIHSNPYYCYATADSQGFWSCKVNQHLPAGIHHVYVSALSTLGSNYKYNPFEIIVNPKLNASNGVASSSFNISSNFKPSLLLINQQATFTLNAQGGIAPYAFNISWGDGSSSNVTRISSGPFNISHTYSKTNALIQSKTIKIEGIDAQGDSTSLQMFASIKNPAYSNVVAYISQYTGLNTFLSNAKNWLWIIWPAYIIIMLMIISFWLGEREEIILLINRRRHHRSKRKPLTKVR